MIEKKENSGFICDNCKAYVEPLTNGSFRNHCPFCLYSVHIDENIGDRKSECLGLMKPVDIEYNSKKGYQIVHKCEKCGKISRNKVASDTVQEDNRELIYQLLRNKIK